MPDRRGVQAYPVGTRQWQRLVRLEFQRADRRAPAGRQCARQPGRRELHGLALEDQSHANFRPRSRSLQQRADRQQRPRSARRLRPVLDQPAALAGDRRQPRLGVDRDGEADGLEHRQVAGRVGVGDRLFQLQTLRPRSSRPGSGRGSRRWAAPSTGGRCTCRRACTVISAAMISSNSGRRPCTAKSSAPVIRIVRCPSARCSRTRRMPAGKLLVRIRLVSSSLRVLVDLADRGVLVAPVEEPQEVAAVLAVHRAQARCLGKRAQHVANPLGRVQSACRQERVALDDVAGDQRVLEVERGDVAIGGEHAAAQPVGAVVAALARLGLGARVVHDRRQVDGADVRRPVDAARVDVERRLIGGVETVVDAHQIGRLDRSPRTRCRGRTAARTGRRDRCRSCVSSSLAAHDACLPRSGSACSTRSVFSAIVLARSQLLLHPAARRELPLGHDDRLALGVVQRVLGEPAAHVVDERLVAQRIDAAAGDLGDARRLGRARARRRR